MDEQRRTEHLPAGMRTIKREIVEELRFSISIAAWIVGFLVIYVLLFSCAHLDRELGLIDLKPPPAQSGSFPHCGAGSHA